MPGTFTEQNVEDMIIHAVEANGWDYIRAEDLPRAESDVLVEKHLREALIRLNPCIAENPAHADTVIINYGLLYQRCARMISLPRMSASKSSFSRKTAFPSTRMAGRLALNSSIMTIRRITRLL